MLKEKVYGDFPLKSWNNKEQSVHKIELAGCRIINLLLGYFNLICMCEYQKQCIKLAIVTVEKRC